MWGLSPVVASRGHPSSQCVGLSLSRPLLLWSTGSRRAGRSAACGIFPDQGSNPCPLHWQADSQSLRHQGSPLLVFLMWFIQEKNCKNLHNSMNNYKANPCGQQMNPVSTLLSSVSPPWQLCLPPQFQVITIPTFGRLTFLLAFLVLWPRYPSQYGRVEPPVCELYMNEIILFVFFCDLYFLPLRLGD